MEGDDEQVGSGARGLPVLEYQSYPEFLPPDALPDTCREDVAVLYIAHLCYEHMRGAGEQEMKIPFLRDYLEVLGRSGEPRQRAHSPWLATGGLQSIGQLVVQEVLPRLNKALSTFPKHARDFLTESTDRVMDGIILDSLAT